MSLFWEKHIKLDINIFGFREKPYYGLSLFFYVFKLIRKCKSPNWRIVKHAKGLLLLEKEGLLNNYYEFLREHNAYSDQASAHNFYYFQFIKDRFAGKNDLNFMEIGAGGAYLLCFVSNTYQSKIIR